MLKLLSKKDCECKSDVMKFCSLIGYQLFIENGQRIIRSTNKLPDEMKSWEIYVSKIPKCVNEVELFKLFYGVAGEIYELRIMYNEDHVHRSFCYMKFFDIKSFRNAISLNYREIRMGCLLYVTRSVNNCSLYVGGLPRFIKFNVLVTKLKTYVNGIVDVYFPNDIHNDELNRGYAFVKFENHKLAYVARKILFGSLKFNGMKVLVDWSDPIVEPDPIIMSGVTTLYLSNLAYNTTDEDVRSHIEHYVPFAREITRIIKMKNYCFVHFTKRKHAQEAIPLLEGTTLLNKIIQVEWSKPQQYKKTNMKKVVDRTYGSLPDRFMKK